MSPSTRTARPGRLARVSQVAFRFPGASPTIGVVLALIPAAVLWAVRTSQNGWLGWIAGWAALGLMGLFYLRCQPRFPWIVFWPSLWLSLSMPATRAWLPPSSGAVAWVVFFIGMILTTRMSDGRWILALWLPVWVAASSTLPGVWLVPLGFALFPPTQVSGRPGTRATAVAVALGLGLLAFSRGSLGWPLQALAVLTDLAGKGYALVPALFFWLGAGYASRQSPLRFLAGQVGAWVLAWSLLGGAQLPWFGPDTAICLLLAGAGFGLETLRRDVLDLSWHATLVWTSLGLAMAAAFNM